MRARSAYQVLADTDAANFTFLIRSTPWHPPETGSAHTFAFDVFYSH